jgi:hypothetical protein
MLVSCGNRLLQLIFTDDPRSARRFGTAFALHQRKGEESAAGGMHYITGLVLNHWRWYP